MTELFTALQLQWAGSARFRIWTILATSMLVISTFLSVCWQLGLLSLEGLPPRTDLNIYLDASHRFLERQALYLAPLPSFELYAYSPAFAIALSPLTFLPYQFLLAIDIILHLAAYAVLYWRWFVIFRTYRLDSAAEKLIGFLPLWLVFSGLWYDTSTLNLYLFMALVGTWLLESILAEQIGWSIFWLAILLPIKPQWAFALGIPVLLRHWRFLSKVIAGGVLAYIGTILGAALIAGPYILNQYWAYLQFLQSVPMTFFWNTLATTGYIGYNNSIMQLVAFFINAAPDRIGLTYGIKILLLTPLLGLLWRKYRLPTSSITTGIKLEWAFALYLGAFIWLDVVTELSFGIVIFIYLLGTLSSRRAKFALWILFGPYALQLLWLLIMGIISFAIPLPNSLVDPSRFIPYILIAMLGLYGIILKQLWGVKQ